MKTLTFKKWFKLNFNGSKFGACVQDDGIQLGWLSCKHEVLKIIEDEIDNGKGSLAEAAKKIREL